jgi:hypothetical protein
VRLSLVVAELLRRRARRRQSQRWGKPLKVASV